MEGWGVHQRHRPGAREASRLYPRSTQSYRWDRSASATQIKMGAHSNRAGGDLPGTRRRRFDARYRAPVGAAGFERKPGGGPRNGGRRHYRALKADERAWERARRPKRCLFAENDRLGDVVAKKLKEDCSPQQIAGWLARRYPDDEVMRVSHESIYRTLFVQTKGALKKELLAHLRSGRTMRK